MGGGEILKGSGDPSISFQEACMQYVGGRVCLRDPNSYFFNSLQFLHLENITVTDPNLKKVTPNVAKSIAVVGFDFLALHVIGCWVCRGPLCRQRTPRYRVSLLLPKVQPGHLWTEGGCTCLNLLYSHWGKNAAVQAVYICTYPKYNITS